MSAAPRRSGDPRTTTEDVHMEIDMLSRVTFSSAYRGASSQSIDC